MKPKRRSFSTYEQAQAYLDRRVNLERVSPSRVTSDEFKLERMRAIASVLGDPQDQLRVVHVAGSKGKGSVCEMVASCLAANGYTTGLFTSPHLVTVRERISLDGEPIDEDSFRRLMGRVAGAASAVAPVHGEASYFEIVTLLGLLYFAEQAVDVAVLEVGLGGRLDSTNIVKPEVAAVGAIQLEHTAILGDTLEKIAAEKAGIFKAEAPALTFDQSEEVMATLRRTAEAAGTDLRVLGRDIEFSWRVEASPELGQHVRVCLTSPRSTFEHLVVPLPGEHQAHNCGLALAILDELAGRGFRFTERQVAEGLSQTPRRGRLERVWDRPRVVIDGAHNPESVRAAVRAVASVARSDSMIMVFGCASDKDIDGMLREVALGADKVIFTRAADNPRATDPEELRQLFAEISPKMTQTAPDLRSAINLAARALTRDDLILVTGSFHLAGETKRLFDEKRALGG